MYVKFGRASMVLIVAVMLSATLLPMSAANEGTGNIWDRISIERGTTDALGGGDYIAIKTNNSSISIIYGGDGKNNTVKIVSEMQRYAGGVKIYSRNGTLVTQKILRYRFFLGQSFNYIGEVRNLNDSRQMVKYVALRTQWKMSGFKITNLSANETRIDFTIYVKNLPYTEVSNNSEVGDGVVNYIALHFHITASLEKRTLHGFPWYAYQPGKGIHLIGRRNYTGEVVRFQIKYDKEIDGWDYVGSSKIIVQNNIFWGISGNEKVLHLLMKRYGGCRARIGNHTYGNETLPRHRLLFKRRGAIEFTELGQWDRIGRFRWESNVTVDNQTRQAYYQIVGGERIVRWYRHRAFALTVLNGALIYPAGERIFQDPSIELSQYYLNFGPLPLPTAAISFISVMVLAVFVLALLIYRIKK